MPKPKTVVRKDNPNDVEVYKKGGKIKRFDGGSTVLPPSMLTSAQGTDVGTPIMNADDYQAALGQLTEGSKKGGKIGLYANIHAKQERIAHGSGEKMRKPGSKGAPSKEDFIQSAKTRKKK
jgi:hypothetical protein